MVRLEAETDIERLRQVAILLSSENERLHQKLLDLTRRLAVAEGRVATQLELELEEIKEQLRRRNHLLFGDRSEKRPREREKGFGTEKSERHGHGPRTQAALPIVETVHELDAADQVCNSCGGALSKWEDQFEDSEEIDVVEREFRIVKHRRQKYRCKCGGCIETALGAPKLVSGGRYSVDFALLVAISKYADHLPLARQVKQMQRLGLRIDTQTLWDQLLLLWQHLQPTYQALHAHVLSFPVIGADETTWRLMEKEKAKRWWVWALTCPEAVYYRLQGSRSAEAARKVLGEYRGIVIADGYSAYASLQKTLLAQTVSGTETFRLVNCWAHVRRRFVEAEANFSCATEMVDLIGKLYGIEARATTLGEKEPAAVLGRMRQHESKPLLGEIQHWLMTHRSQCLPQSSLGKAISYCMELWAGLVGFVDDPLIPIDNNATERGLRAAAVGRKNHYGSRSERGTEVAALFYSLIESAKIYGHEPAYYLREATHRAIDNPGTITLPRDVAMRTNVGADTG